MSNQKNELNPYLGLGILLDKKNGVDFDKIKEFVEQYLKISQNKGEKADDIIMRIKNFSTDLHDCLMNNCIQIQANIPELKSYDPTRDRVSVADAAKIYGVTTATIRNWIKNENNKLESINTGDRQTTISLDDLHGYTKRIAKSKK